MALKIGNSKIITRSGYPILQVEINGDKALILWEQKAISDDLIFLGAEFEDRVPVITLPPDRSNGQPEPQEMRGFTKDEEIRALYDDYIQQINEG